MQEDTHHQKRGRNRTQTTSSRPAKGRAEKRGRHCYSSQQWRANEHPREHWPDTVARQGDRGQASYIGRCLSQPYWTQSVGGGNCSMSRVLTIIAAHFKSWYRSRSNIFWTIAFPLLLIVLFGAIFGNGSTKFDLYVQNQDLIAATPTPLSLGYVATLNNTGAFTLHMVPAEQQKALDFVKSDAQLHNRGQRLLVVPVGFNESLTKTKTASIQLYIDKSDQASASLAGVVNAATASYATELSRSN